MHASTKVVISFVVIAGCGDDGGGGGDAGASMVPPETQPALVALITGTSGSVALGAPLLPEAEALRDDTRVDQPLMRDTAAQESVEMGVSGNSIVTDPMCVAYVWSGLMVDITFTSCTLEATGESLTGAMQLAVSFAPTEMRMTFTDLMVGDLGLDGWVAVRTGGNCPTGMDTCLDCRDTDPTCTRMREPQQTLLADITISLAETFAIDIVDGTISHDATGSTLNATGTVDGTTLDGAYTATALFWATGACLPSSGTVVYTPEGGTPISIGFTSATPATGEVEVTIAPFPTTTQALFTPCGM